MFGITFLMLIGVTLNVIGYVREITFKGPSLLAWLNAVAWSITALLLAAKDGV